MSSKKQRKLPIGISFPKSLLDRIDKLSGQKSRSEFVVDLIEKALEKHAQRAYTTDLNDTA